MNTYVSRWYFSAILRILKKKTIVNPILTQDTSNKKWTSRLSPKGCFYFLFLDVLFFTHWILSLSQTSRSRNRNICLRMIYQDSHRSCASWESSKIICKLVKKIWLVVKPCLWFMDISFIVGTTRVIYQHQ